MTLLSIAPDIMAGASRDLEGLSSELRSANAAAATQTTAVAAPAADEVSAAFAALLSSHAEGFHALSAKAAAFHDEFVKLLSGSSAQYMGTEATSAASVLGINLPNLNLPSLNLPGLHLPSINLPGIGLPGIPLLTEALGLTGGFKTPFGPLNFLTGSGSATIFSNGNLQGSLTAGLFGRPSLGLTFDGAPVSGSLLDPAAGFTEALTSTGTLRTPFGPLQVLTANGTATLLPNGHLDVSLTAHVPLSPPFYLSVAAAPVSSTTGLEEALSATGFIKTPFGALTLLTADGTATVLPNGDLDASIVARVPLLPALSLSITGVPSGIL
ncbi:PE family protein [Mycobacterium conspicuum]|uniref:PE family protein n=1 Tax=Mycobacterium conspicuum TaxID=44010 RepID=UPI0013D4E888|nr:PE family protein [Mycobacterium conspicuum]